MKLTTLLLREKAAVYCTVLAVFLFGALTNAQTLVSDDFSPETSLKSHWSFLDVQGVSSYTANGTNLLLEVPAGTAHDLWTNAAVHPPMILQDFGDVEFAFEIKFETIPTAAYQEQGIVIQENANKFIRFSTYMHASDGLKLFAADVGSSTPVKIHQNATYTAPVYMRVSRIGDAINGYTYTLEISDDGSSFYNVPSFQSSTKPLKVGFFAGNASGTNTAPAYSASVDYFWNLDDVGFTDTDIAGQTPPVVDVWYGDTQDFGLLGNPQTFVNIVGNVSDAQGINSFTYELNGGGAVAAPLGADGKRLVSNGDFNIEIDYADLNPGANTLELTAVDVDGATEVKTVTINYTAGNVWSLPYSIDWQAGGALTDYAQVIDGHWEITPDGVSPVVAGYDRILVVGDETWVTNYEVTMPITIHTQSGSYGVGLATGWQGHEGTADPRLNWPLEAIGWIRGDNLNILTYPSGTDDSNSIPGGVQTETPYVLKMKTVSLGTGFNEITVTLYNAADLVNPVVTSQANVPSRNGSILLLVHLADVTLGNVTVTPVSGNVSPQFTSTPALSVVKDDPYSYAITTGDANAGDDLTITAPTLPSWLTLTDNNDGTATLTGTPGAAEVGQHDVTLRVTDQDGAYSEQDFSIVVSSGAATDIISDDFEPETTLNGFWRFYDPYAGDAANESSVILNGTTCVIDVPAGATHDLWSGSDNKAPRVLQSAPDDDFEIEVKFLSEPTQKFQLQGVIVQQDNDTFLRFGQYHNGSTISLFLAFIDGTYNDPINITNNTGGIFAPYIRVARVGNDWTYSYSFDGITWVVAKQFTQVMAVTEVGFYGGNHTPSPAFQCEVEYFNNPNYAPAVTADISVDLSVDNPNPNDGDNVTITTTVTNDGPDNATGVAVTLAIPANLVNRSYTTSDGGIDHISGVWFIGDLPAGDVATLELNADLDLYQSAADLGAATDFNVFVLQDINQPSSMTQGKMAAGRNLSLGAYSVGSGLPASGGTEDVLVAGQDLFFNGGTVGGGNVVYGGSSNLPSNLVTVFDGAVRKEAGLIDFGAAQTNMLALSNTLKDKAANGATEFKWGSLYLTGTDPIENVFHVSGADLTAAVNVDITVPDGAVALINIDGQTISWLGGLSVNGTDMSNALFNFYQATTLNIQGINITGSVLAPKADVTYAAGVVNGQLISKFLSGSGSFNNVPFVGNLPPSADITVTAELTALDQDDPDSTPGNGVDTEDDYDEVTLVTGSGGGNNGGGNSGWDYSSSFTGGQIIWSLYYANGLIYAGTVGGNLYVTADGISWSIINAGMNVGFIWSIVVDASGTIFVATEQGVFSSSDNGANWASMGLSFANVRTLVLSGTTMYAGTWGSGVFVSTNAGATWSALNNNLNSLIVNSLAVDQQGNLYAGTFGFGVSVLVSGETQWEAVPIAYNFIWAVGVSVNGVVYAGTYGDGLYYSTDQGVTWSKMGAGLPASFIYNIAPAPGGGVVVNSWESGVYFVQDNTPAGQIAPVAASAGLRGEGVSAVMVDPVSGDILAVTREGGVLRHSGEITGVESESGARPSEFALEQNYPNPFNPETTIRFLVPVDAHVSLKIYDIRGAEITTLVSEVKSAGTYRVSFNASNLPSGIYFYRMQAGTFHQTRKLMLVK